MLGSVWLLLLRINWLDDRVSESGKTLSQAFKGAWPVLAAGLVLGLVLFLGAKRYVRRKKHHAHSSPPAILAARDQDADDGHRHHRKRRRKRRRDHRPRNPTLAETGGLPQPRSPDTPPPAPQI